jgi:hypothetical protein
MSYECKTLTPPSAGTAQVCMEWQEASFLPELTGADRDVILQWAIGIFALVFVVRKIMRFL